VLAGFVTAPMAAVLVPEPAAIIRAVALLPFGALIAAFGVECLWDLRLLVRPRPLILSASAIIFLVAVAYAMKTISSESRLTRSTAILVFASVALFVVD